MHPELSAYMNRLMRLEEQKIKEATSAALTHDNEAKMKRQEVKKREFILDQMKTMIAAAEAFSSLPRN